MFLVGSNTTRPEGGEVAELVCCLVWHGRERSQEAESVHLAGSGALLGRHPGSVRFDETRIFHRLFKSDNPLAAVPDYKADIDRRHSGACSSRSGFGHS